MSGNDIDSLAKRHAEVLHELEQVRDRHKEAMALIEKHREENQTLKAEVLRLKQAIRDYLSGAA